MYIVKNDKNEFKKFKLIRKFYKIYFLITIVFLIISSILIIDSGIWKEKKSVIINKYYYSGVNNYLYIFDILGKSILSKLKPKFDEISLNINQKNILILEKNRQDILEGKLTGSGDDRFKTVKASIATNDDKFDISLRIKGDRIQNFINMDSISYKIKINKNESFKNMRKFSLIKPRIRNYIHEWLFHEFGRTQNLTTINYDFVYLNVNGKNNGLYAIEENFDSWLIEKNKDRYGPIFSMREEFDEDFMSSEFELYNKNFWKKDENLLLASTAIKKLKLFQEGKNTLEDTFDLNQWAKYFSIIDLTYTFHGASPRNVKFFFNPITSLFEPIPYDGHRVIVNYNKNITNYDHSTLFDKAKNGMVSGRT